MKKKISVTELRLGMHIDSLCGAWLDHPFWRTKFTLSDPEDIVKIQRSSITAVWIDVTKGCDSESVDSWQTQPEDQEAEFLASAESQLQAASFHDELYQAAKICTKGRELVVSMFHEARMGNAIDADLAVPLVEEISNSILRNPGALVSLARLKSNDDYTYMHSVAVCALMISLSRELGLDEPETRCAGMAGLLHDIGKAMIPECILNKPGKLTDTEFDIIKTHPEEGHRLLLDGVGVHEVAKDVCLHHHEKIDGTGYPHGLGGERLCLHAKMGAVCDVYDAVTSNRPYKSGWDPADSLARMAEWTGHFEPSIFRAFVKALGIYPVGSLVHLVDSGPSQSPRPIRHEQSAQFAMSRSPEYHEQHSRSGTAHAQQRNDAHERCYA